MSLNPAWRDVDEAEQRAQDERVRARSVEDGREAIEERPRAGQRPRVDERQQELGIVGLELLELAQLAHLVSDDHADVPQRVQERAEEGLFGRADGAAEENQQIDVGVQTEVPPAIAAEREHGHRSLGGWRFGEQLPQQHVGAIGIPLEHGTAARPSGDVGPQFVARGGDRRREVPASGAGLGYETVHACASARRRAISVSS